MISYGRQSITEEDIKAVTDVLRSDYLTQGPVVPQFEKAICDFTGAGNAVAVNSATSALHLACLALGLGPGDVLWTSPITFVASANCALYCGAEVDFVDIDPQTFNMSVEALKDKLERAQKQGRLPKVVVPVHLCGTPCDMEAISVLSEQYGFSIIEDASHAIGGQHKGEKVGSCRYSDITVFSFHPVKNITTGEGGAATSKRDDLADKMRLLRSHGVTRDAGKMTREPDGPWYYQQIALGYNYRMTDFQAALGISQLTRLEGFIQRRNQVASRYKEHLAELPIKIQMQDKASISAYHLFVIRLDLEVLDMTRLQIIERLRDSGVGATVHYIPVHTQPWYKEMGFKEGDFPVAEKFYQEAVTIPIYPDLQEDECVHVVSVLREMMT